MRTALREAKESKCAIFATIIINMERRLASRRKGRGDGRLKD
jgi:hypothetical protein